MKKKHLQPLTSTVRYARVSSNRQDMDLTVSVQLRSLNDGRVSKSLHDAID